MPVKWMKGITPSAVLNVASIKTVTKAAWGIRVQSPVPHEAFGQVKECRGEGVVFRHPARRARYRASHLKRHEKVAWLSSSMPLSGQLIEIDARVVRL